MIRTFLTLLLLAAPEAAAATTVVLQRDGAPVPNGEVCWFRAGDRENPFLRWLMSQDVKCAAAGTDVTFPRGVWNVFGRAGDAISIEPLLVDGESAPARLDIRLATAATVVPLLPEKHRGVIYVPKRASAIPAEERTTVPADEELWLFVLEKARPVAVITIPALAAGTERTVDARSGSPAWSVLGWLRIPEEDRTALANATGIVSPGVRAVADAATRDAEPFPPLSLLHGAFVRVRDVPPGDAELRLEGSGWLPDRKRMKVDRAVSLVEQPLIVRAAATLTVHWSTEDDLPALDRSLGGCDGFGGGSLIQILVSRCAPPRPGTPPDPDSCTVIKEERFDPQSRFDLLTLEDLGPGAYRAELRYGKLPPIIGSATVAPLRPAEIRLRASYHQAHGSVTRGGEPLGEEVKIQFPSGPGFAPAQSEDYHAVLRGMLGVDAQITVAACDGSPRVIVLAEEAMIPGRRFDIDIPANRLAIEVTDTFTSERLRGATVRFQVLSLRYPKRPVLEGTLKTNEEGIAVMESVPPLRDILLTVTQPGYQKKPIQPFSMTKTDRKSVDVQLVPLRGIQGKIVSDRPFDRGMVFWYSPSGSETERVDLAEDGTFVYMGAHPPEETMAVVSPSHPLWVLRSPAVERRQAMNVRFPMAPVRSFSAGVITGYVSTWYIGLEIGGVRVPPPALAMHQSLRRDPTMVRAGVNMRIQDVLATGAIEVILGPTTDEVTGPARGMDFFALPKFAGRPRQRLGPEAAVVMFEVK